MLFRGTTKTETKTETQGEIERENRRERRGERDREQSTGLGTEVQMLVVWDLEFDQATGLGESKLSVEVALPGYPPGGPHARRRNLNAPSASPWKAMHAVKLDVEKAFGELVHHAGFVRAVRTVVAVLFGVHVKPDFDLGPAEGDGGGGGVMQDDGEAEQE